MVAVVDDWWGGRHLRHLLPRLWLQHFTTTSWVAVDEEERLVGFLIGFVSPDHPGTAYCHMIATDPNRRRIGLGRSLYERFFADAQSRGATSVRAITWPGNRTSVAFHRALGFEMDAGEGTQVLYGAPAYPDYDGEGEDRVVFRRPV
jgi:ribosomal protein S18 acetylase RimI-like enzyme